MKNPRIIKLLLLLTCSIPYAFLCLYGDAMHGTMLFYAVMIVCFFLLCRLAVRTKNLPILFTGSLLSFLSSSAAAKLTDLSAMDYYFKPFTARTLILALSLIALLVQTLYVLRAHSKEMRRTARDCQDKT